MTIFDSIRLVADSELSLAAKGFFLRLIPLVDSKTCSSSWSTSRVAHRLDISVASVKRYRRDLIKIGALERRRGWHFASKSTETEVEATTPVATIEQSSSIKSDTEQVISIKSDTEQTISIKSDTKKVSYLTPSNHYRTASLSASDRSIDRARKLANLPSRFRPDLKDREPEHDFDLNTWSKQWRKARGVDWRWNEWSTVVCPHLTGDEQRELFAVLSGVDRPNLAFAKSIVERLVDGRPVGRSVNRPVPVSTEDDELFEAIG